MHSNNVSNQGKYQL
jgi:uncharacterized protein (DUF2267 family)